MKIYLVGGAVRDEILGRPVKDRDWVVVDATPKDMLDLGYEQVGADFPVFLHPVTREEYALARVERKIGEGYHGFEVSTKNVTIKEDLGRRDLTINAIAKDPETGEYIDPYGGINDIDHKLLTACGLFHEDPLRVIRLARFAARYTDFEVFHKTAELATKMINEGRLNELPYERFWTELEKVVHEPGVSRFFKLLSEWGGFTHIKFFQEIFGEQDDSDVHWGWVETMCKVVQERVPEDKRMMVLVAILARREAINPAGASAELLKLHKNLYMTLGAWDAAMHMPNLINYTHELMKMLKPWGEGPHYDNVILATRCLEAGFRKRPYFLADQLERLRKKVCVPKAEHFPNLQGKELGEAIDKARKINIELAL